MEFLILIIFHFIADFIFQDEEWALNKSKNNQALINHVYVYSLIMGLGATAVFAYVGLAKFTAYSMLVFISITFVAHFFTDFVTSRIVAYQSEEKHYGSSMPNFGMFTTIGFDQLLHYLQLYFTLQLILP